MKVDATHSLGGRAPDEDPAWHAEVLAAREARVAAGLEKSIPWEEAKAQLRSTIRDLSEDRLQ